MKKVRFFNSIFLEALDQRIILILESHNEIVKQTNNAYKNQEIILDKKITERLNLLITSKDSTTIKYKLRQLYIVEKYTAQRTAFITRKSTLTTLTSIFEEFLIELRAILVKELDLLDHEVLKITAPHQIHRVIINNLAIYSKTLNSSWFHIKEAIDINSNLNKDVETLTNNQKETLLKIKSINQEKLQSGIQIMALTDYEYHHDLIRAIEVYFVEMNDSINQRVKKTPQ
ncbi:hypothetical protein L0657_22635 [Dyadobacter sp. CY345]|uniref:hypothetical protein n=1 Tax=Dyadobacter sp. CY345 TaxID=2909335 RepID=UPI001F343587|nr:hypothetical protein [Dyadobacter sp. CY345]MCF2446772.1 hypothetical protein [Dyadobacter sp. CY345]